MSFLFAWILLDWIFVNGEVPFYVLLYNFIIFVIILRTYLFCLLS
ncbi:hypothetical protein LEP1GSC125_2793 [Leptospira mayottensis 200901122]|uniref:Uncharacterized protein n=1 Tax=Leptospira mayottensis 200901122 TaxID=1193010 RepID=A0AA87MMI7_9LEPT|nr:hypothetical protein LEP1GSC125_2793 [Leptospira mayottensis 200901122]